MTTSIKSCGYSIPVVSTIRYNLERYHLDNSGLTLLKEFIQNADDAKSEILHFGYLPAVSSSLSFWEGPSFWFIRQVRALPYGWRVFLV